ncbi:MAG: hypothetical protein ACR2NL_10025 [Acidimicrobiia bacterium]
MTTSELTALNEWADHPLGKAARIAIAVTGLATSAIVLLLATLGSNAIWFMVLLGVALAATSIRAAMHPSLVRLTTLAAVMVAIPIVGQII